MYHTKSHLGSSLALLHTYATESIPGKAIAGIARANIRAICVGAQVLTMTAITSALVDICIQESQAMITHIASIKYECI